MTSKTIESIYEDFLKKRCIILKGEIDDKVIECIVMQIIKWNNEDNILDCEWPKSYNRKDNPIRIYIHSCGGFVMESLSVVSAIISSKTPVYTYALGDIYSSALTIFIVGHKRYAQHFSRFMYHDISSSCIGKIQELEEDVLEHKKLSLIYKGLMKEYTTISEEMLHKIHREKLNKFWLASEAEKLKIFDYYF